MFLFAHRGHSYEDRARKVLYVIPIGICRELPDEVGALLLRAHPEKLCDVSREDNPAAHSCKKSVGAVHQDTVVAAPPLDTMVRPRMSRQKRQTLKEAKRRSCTARVRDAKFANKVS